MGVDLTRTLPNHPAQTRGAEGVQDAGTADSVSQTSGEQPSGAPVDAMESTPSQLSTGTRESSLPESSGSARPGDRARFTALAGEINEATKDKFNGGHATGAIFDILTLGMTGGAFMREGMRALPGSVVPDEATALTDQARQLPPEDQRVLAGALSRMMANDSMDLRTDKDIDTGEKTESSDILQGYIDSVDVSSMTPGERAMSSLLADMMSTRIAIDGTDASLGHVEAGDSVPRNDIYVTNEGLDRLEESLSRVPLELRSAAKTYLSEAYTSHEWPDAVFAHDVMVRLASVVTDNSDEMAVIRNFGE